ncbi:MAG: hypothetical protein NC548_42910 [Lachnospiraceae bacterium]|nr:hypothetical protein [Lachnospiraceae bacterium]
MKGKALILVTDKVTSSDIPLIAQYNPFIVSKEPITNMEVIRAFHKKGLRGISGVDKIENVKATIGKDSICINDSVPIEHIIAAIAGKSDFTFTQALATENERHNESANQQVDIQPDIVERLDKLEVAVNALTKTLNKLPGLCIVKTEEIGG